MGDIIRHQAGFWLACHVYYWLARHQYTRILTRDRLIVFQIRTLQGFCQEKSPKIGLTMCYAEGLGTRTGNEALQVGQVFFFGLHTFRVFWLKMVGGFLVLIWQANCSIHTPSISEPKITARVYKYMGKTRDRSPV